MESRRLASVVHAFALPLLGGLALAAGCRAHQPAPPPVAKLPATADLAPAPKPVRAKAVRAAKPAPPAKPVDAWIKADPFCVLPLARPEVPSTGGQLVDSMLAAWKKALTFKDPSRVITLVGGRYPSVDSMRVDLSHASAIPNVKREKVGDRRPGTQSLAVRDFAIVAEPLVSQKTKSQADMQVTGTDVRFDLQKDKAGQPLLLLADAKSGTLHFDIAVADLERAMLAGAKERGGPGLLTIRSVDIDLRTVGPRSIDVSLRAGTLVGFVPAGLRFTARVDVDDQMNARISNLTADGDEVLGPLLVQFIRPGLSKYDGKTKPLMSFPNPQLKLKDVQIRGGDRITLDAVFGR